MNQVTHITPRFLPQIDGLGDYARLLATELNQGYGFESRFVVGDPQWNNQSVASPFSVSAVRSRSPEDLLRELNASETVILHYVCYGYHNRGTPVWINRAIRRWKASGPDRRLVVVFHELWASGPPWKSEFYLGWVQRRLVHELQHLADGSITSTSIMLRMLDAISPGKTAFAPIPSCVTPPPPANGSSRSAGTVTAVIFGQESSRRLSVEAHAKLIVSLYEAGVLGELRVIGKGAAAGASPSKDVELLQRFLPPEKITVFRDLPATDLAKALSGGDLFLSYYPSALLCKSSALTAAMACGCLPVLPELNNAHPLVDGREILGCDGSAHATQGIVDLIRTGRIPALCDHARAWYDANASWAIATRAAAQFLGADRVGGKRTEPTRATNVSTGADALSKP